MKSFDIEFQPYLEEINAKEGVIRTCADAATMERVRGKHDSTLGVWGKSNACLGIEGVLQDITSELKPLAKLNG